MRARDPFMTLNLPYLDFDEVSAPNGSRMFLDEELWKPLGSVLTQFKGDLDNSHGLRAS